MYKIDKLKLESILTTKQIGEVSNNGNLQVGMKIPVVGHEHHESHPTVILAYFSKPSYDNRYEIREELFHYHMKDDGGKVQPNGQQVNKRVVEKNGAYVFVEVTPGRFKYLGFRKLQSYDWSKRFFVFEIEKELMQDSLQLIEKARDKDGRSKIKKHIIGLPSKVSEVVYDYASDLPIEDLKFAENSIHEVLIKVRKRNAELKDLAIEKYGKFCEVCNLDLDGKYGKDNSVAHVHHRDQLSSLKDKEVHNSIKDVAVVCPTCHAVIHKNPRKAKTISEIKMLLKDNN